MAGLCGAAIVVIVLTSLISFIFGYLFHLKCKTKELTYQRSYQNHIYEETNPTQMKNEFDLTDNSACGRESK